MKKLTLLTLLCLFVRFAAAQQHDTTACEKLFYVKRISNNFWLLNMGGDYPNQKYTIVLKAYRKPAELYRLKDSTICVTGRRQLYRGRVQIVTAQLSGH